jgi:potassium-dependent mechanosensitive channel
LNINRSYLSWIFNIIKLKGSIFFIKSIGSDKGVVKKISIRSTEVETFNKKTLIIPNSAFISSTVHNQTANPITRLVTEVGVSYDPDVRLVMKLLLEVVHEYNKVFKHPKPSVSFSNFDDSAFVFELKTHVKYGAFMESDPAAGLYTEIRARIAKKFKEHDIEVPFPQRDIRLIQDTQKVINLNVESFDQSGILPKKENSK